jgi:hypothetical protein
MREVGLVQPVDVQGADPGADAGVDARQRGVADADVGVAVSAQDPGARFPRVAELGSEGDGAGVQAHVVVGDPPVVSVIVLPPRSTVTASPGLRLVILSRTTARLFGADSGSRGSRG